MDFIERDIDIVQAVAADEEREVQVGRTDHVFRLTRACFVPATAVAVDATDYVTITIYKGPAGTALGLITTETGATYAAALVKGTPAEFTLTATGADLEFDEDDVLEVGIVGAGAAAVVDGSLHLEFQPRRI